MLIEDDFDFVKSQIDFHKRLASGGKDEFTCRRHNQLAARFELLLERLQDKPANNEPERAEEDDEDKNLSQINGSTTLLRSKLRLGDISDLPQALKDQLAQGRSDDLEQTIINVIRARYNGAAAIDEILVGVYRETGEVLERQPLSTKLYRMTRKQVLHSVSGRKGIYSVSPVAE